MQGYMKGNLTRVFLSESRARVSCRVQTPDIRTARGGGETHKCGVSHQEVDASHAAAFLVLVLPRAPDATITLLIGHGDASQIFLAGKGMELLGGDVRTELAVYPL